MLQSLAPKVALLSRAPIKPGRPVVSTRLAGPLATLGQAIAADDFVFVHRPIGEGAVLAHHRGESCRRAGFSELQIPMGDAGCLRWTENPDTGDALLSVSVAAGDGTVLCVGYLFAIATLPRRRAAESAMLSVVPMLAHIVGMTTHVGLLEAELAGCRGALDRCDMGIVLLSADEAILFENRAARALLDTGLGIRRSGRSLAANEMSDTLRLRVAIEHVLQQGGAGGRMPMLALRRGRGQRPLLASVVAPGDAPLSPGCAAIVYLFDPERDVSHLLDAACRLYGLSPVESRLAAQLACGVSLTEAAVLLRIKAMTARGYLKQIFIKTGVNRQAALVRLMMSSMIRLTDDIELEVV